MTFGIMRLAEGSKRLILSTRADRWMVEGMRPDAPAL